MGIPICISHSRKYRRIRSSSIGYSKSVDTQQIQSIAASKKIRKPDIFNRAIHWIKDNLIVDRPEEEKQLPVVIVAEYITVWVMDALKGGKKHLESHEPIPQQTVLNRVTIL